MVMTCLECGDKGFSNAFVYCVKCLDLAVHRYCLAKLPEPIDEFVHWVCEDCLSVSNQTICQKHISIPSQKGGESSLDHSKLTQIRVELRRNDLSSENVTVEHGCHGCSSQQGQEACFELDLTDSAQLPGNHSPWKVELKKEKEGKPSLTEARKQRCQSSCLQQHCDAHSTLALTRYAQVSGVAGSVAKTQDQRLWINPSWQPQEAYTNVELTDCYESASDSPLKTKLKRKEGSSLVPKIEEKRQEIHSSQQSIQEGIKLDLPERAKSQHSISPPTVESNKRRGNACGSLIDEDKQMHKSCLSKQPRTRRPRQDLMKHTVLMNGSHVNATRSTPLCHDNGKEKMKLGEEKSLVPNNGRKLGEKVSQSAIRMSSNISEHDLQGRAQPVIDPIWRGSFNIINKDYDRFEGFVAHLSSMACSKVFQEASLLPSLLCLEMLPKSHVWPKSFERSEPSDENIALYFFPVDRSCERIFDHLVDEMTRRELAMRVTVKNAELLIFSSTELPLFHWRFQGKYYLWGVFRGKETSRSANRSLVVQNSSNEHVRYLNSADNSCNKEESSPAKIRTSDLTSARGR